MTDVFSKWLRGPPLGDRLRAQRVREDVVRVAEQTPFTRRPDLYLGALEELLTADETLLRIVEARHVRPTGLFALTSRRILFIPAKSRRPCVQEVPLTSVRSASVRTRRGMGQLEVELTDGNPFVVDQILGKQADSLVDDIAAALHPPPDGPLEHRDALVELAELRALYDAGALPLREYEARKAELFRLL
jgi:hypothetical protein